MEIKYTGNGWRTIECSNCGYFIGDAVKIWNYCPNCGAVMGDGETITQIEIDADELRILWKHNDDGKWKNADIDDLIRMYEKQTVNGEWVPCDKKGVFLTETQRKLQKNGRSIWYGFKCSKCGFIYKGNALTESKFCQNCGAKMGGK